MEVGIKSEQRASDFLVIPRFGPVTIYTTGIVFFLLFAAAPSSPVPTWALLLVWSFFGVRQSLQALTLLMLTKLLNPSVYRFADAPTSLSYLVTFAASSRILLSAFKRREVFRRHAPLLLFAAYGAINALTVSYYPLVSFTKICLFTFSTVAILVGFQIQPRRFANWTPWFVGMWLAVIILSLPTLIVSEIGYARDGQGFQGILSHPQTLAVFLAPMVSWMLGQYIFAKERPPIRWLLVLAFATVLMFLTLARTAVVTVASSLILAFVLSARNRRMITGVLRKREGIGMGIIALVALRYMAPGDLISDFLFKGSGALEIGEAYQQSRGFLIIRALESFYEHPFMGIGFGVSLEAYFNPIYDTLTGLPISAFTEKSLLPVVLLEELGVIGLLLFIPILHQLIRAGSLSGGLAIPLLIMSCIMVNIGEAVLFSINGLGLYLWLVIGWALRMAVMEREQKEQNTVPASAL